MAFLAAIFDPQLRLSPDEKKQYLADMARALQRRGKEPRTLMFDDGRLALVQGGDASQPTSHPDGQSVLAIDGSIYGVVGIEEHEAAIAPARLLEIMAGRGADIFPRLDGSYSLAFYTARGELHLARDPFGDKPLYYVENQGVLAFASKLRALKVLPFFDFGLNMNALAEYISFQYVGAPRTIYAGAHKVAPGHRLSCGQNGPASAHRFFAFTPGLPRPDVRPLVELAEDLEERLLRELRRRCHGRNELHASLSGGVDSSTVAALAARHLGVPVHTYSIGFAKTGASEHAQAKVYADILGTRHHERLMTPDACEFLRNIGEIQDEPNGDSSCLPMFTLASFLSEHTGMALAGDCADEFFGGYGRYLATISECGAGCGDLGRRYYSGRILFFDEHQLQALLGCVPKGYADHLARLRAELDEATWLSPLDRMRRSDMENYTPGAVAAKADRMCQYHGVEMCSPFVSLGILRFAEALPFEAMIYEGLGKRVLREISVKYLPAERINGPKSGFGLPMNDWGRKSILAMAGELLGAPESKLAEITGERRLADFMAAQERHFAVYQVWALCVLESYLRHNPSVPKDFEAAPISATFWEHIGPSSIHRALDSRAIRQTIALLAKPVLAFIKGTGQILPEMAETEAEAPAITYVHKTRLADVESIVLDWENVDDWQGVGKRPEAVAWFPEAELPSPKTRKRLCALGIEWILTFENGEALLIPTAIPSWRQRLATMWRLARL